MTPLFYMCRNTRRGDGLWKGGKGGGLLSGIEKWKGGKILWNFRECSYFLRDMNFCGQKVHL